VKQVSPDKDTDFHPASASFTLSPESTGFVVLCRLTPDPRPFMMFLFIAPWFCLGLPSDPASQPRPCLRLVLFICLSFNILTLEQGT
jgi:hypothetical protein